MPLSEAKEYNLLSSSFFSAGNGDDAALRADEDSVDLVTNIQNILKDLANREKAI